VGMRRKGTGIGWKKREEGADCATRRERKKRIERKMCFIYFIFENVIFMFR
jgi:hypothetical protein